MEFVLEVQLCELLHCLPSQLDAEDYDRVEGMRIYFQAKGRVAKRQQAQQEQAARLQQRGTR